MNATWIWLYGHGVREATEAQNPECTGRAHPLEMLSSDSPNDDPATTSKERKANAVNHSEIVSFLWGVADLICDTFKRGKYQDVILPLTVLRRLDCVLAGTKEMVLAKQA